VKAHRAVLYGLSTEGITLVNGLVKADEYLIIDENTRLANSYNRKLSQLMRSEDLSDIVPGASALGGATLIFFGPKQRPFSDWSNVTFHLKFIAANLRRGQHVVNVLPVEKGRNYQMIEVLETISGFKAGKDFGYHYFPVGSPGALASIYDGKREQWMAQGSDMESAEEKYLIDAMDSFGEKVRKVWLRRGSDTFISYYVKGSYAISLVPNSFGKNSTLTSLSRVYLKSVDDFMSFVSERIKERVKELTIKPARASIYLVWDADANEILGESEYYRERFRQKLNESFARTESISMEKIESYVLNFQLAKEEVLVVCDELSESRLKDKVEVQKIIRAAI
jgi:hypothetical protein